MQNCSANHQSEEDQQGGTWELLSSSRINGQNRRFVTCKCVNAKKELITNVISCCQESIEDNLQRNLKILEDKRQQANANLKNTLDYDWYNHT